MSTIAVIHSGSYFHLADLRDPALAAWDLHPLYAPELHADDLKQADAVVLFARQHPRILDHVMPLLLDFAQTPGRRLVLEGENAVHRWLPDTSWTDKHHPVNFWAWRTGEDTGIRLRHLHHPLWNLLSKRAVAWHYHGVLIPPPGATTLATVERDDIDVGAILYHDGVSFPAELLVTTMDPSYHHGAGFMPGATQLLYRELRWAGAALAAR